MMHLAQIQAEAVKVKNQLSLNVGLHSSNTSTSNWVDLSTIF